MLYALAKNCFGVTLNPISWPNHPHWILDPPILHMMLANLGKITSNQCRSQLEFLSVASAPWPAAFRLTSSLMPARKPYLPSNLPPQVPLPRSPNQWCSFWRPPSRIHLWLSKSVTTYPLNRKPAAIIVDWEVKSIWWQLQSKSKPVDNKAQETHHHTFVVLSRFNHSRSVSESSTCLLANQNKVLSNMSAAAWSSSSKELFPMPIPR